MEIKVSAKKVKTIQTFVVIKSVMLMFTRNQAQFNSGRCGRPKLVRPTKSTDIIFWQKNDRPT